MIIVHATVIDGPFKGWSVRASEAIRCGVSPVRVKVLLIAELEAKIEVIREHIKEIEALPDKIEIQ